VIAILIALTGLVFLQAAKGGQTASCDVDPSSVISRSPSNLAQVSNLALLHARAVVSSRRPMPSSGVLGGQRVEATVYQEAASGVRTIVPSAVTLSGGGGDAQSEYVAFTLDIPIESEERDAAIRDYLTAVARAAASSTNERERAMAATVQSTAASALAPMFRQHRVGRFHVECRVLDDGRQVAVGSGDFEILFKGRFFDQEAFRQK
jgi:hypothetical protein